MRRETILSPAPVPKKCYTPHLATAHSLQSSVSRLVTLQLCNGFYQTDRQEEQSLPQNTHVTADLDLTHTVKQDEK